MGEVRTGDIRVLRGLLTLFVLAGIGLVGVRTFLPLAGQPAQDPRSSVARRTASFLETAAGHNSPAVRSPKGHWETDQITAYCTGMGDMMETAQGGHVHTGSAAAGPDVPFGTRFKIPGLRTVTVDDRGSAVGDGHLDVWMPSCSDADKWGVRYLAVKQLG